jgi:colicin import membrane protein
MRSSIEKSIPGALVLALLLCVLGPAGARAQGAAGGLNSITSVNVRGGTVEIVGTKKPNFTTFTLTDPPRLVIDISEAAFSGVKEEIAADNGTLTGVRTANYGSDDTAIARVLIGYAREVETDIQTRGNSLVVSVAGTSSPTVVAAAPPTSRTPATGPAPTARTPEADDDDDGGEAALSTAPDDGPRRQKALAEATQAAQDDRKAQERALAQAAQAAEAERKRQQELAAQAAKATQAEAEARRQAEARAAAERKAQEEAARVAAQQAEQQRVQAERVAQAAEKQRQIDEARVAAETRKRQEAEEKTRREAEARAEADEKRRQREQARATAEQKAREAREEARAEADEKQQRQREEARAEADEKRRQREQARETRVARAEPPARTPPEQGGSAGVSSRRKTLLLVGFRQEPNGSRVFIRTDEPVRYSVTKGDRLVVLELENTRVDAKNSRTLDTSFFDTAVNTVDPGAGPSNTVRVAIRLKRAVPFQTHQEGNELSIEFQRPAPR